MDVDHVDQAIVENYRQLRTRIGLIALAFPVVLIAAGAYWGIGIQPTLSDYYFAKDPVGARIDIYPVRLWFCGILFVIGVFLYRYQGFSVNENRWLSLGGLFSLGVAVFPMSLDGKSDFGLFAQLGLPQLSLHGICGVLAFLCIAVVIFWYSESTLSKLKTADPAAYRRFRAAYFFIGIYMALSIGTSVILHYLDKRQNSFILFAEWSGIWAFAAYWFVKNWEISCVAPVLKAQGGKKPRKTEAEIASAI